MAFQVFAITSSLLLLSIISSLTFRGNFHFQRRLPEYGTVTFPFKYKITIANQDQKPHRDLVLMDELASDFPDYESFRTSVDPLDKHRNWVDRKIGYPRLMSLVRTTRGGALPLVDVDTLPGRDEKEIEIEFVPLRRGYLYFSRTSLFRPDPFGLFRSIINRANPEKLLVLPKTYRVPQVTLSGQRKYQPGGINQASAVGDSQEFLSLRDYQPGDPMRSIHWRSYAKRGEPVVKEFRDEYFVRQGLILDTFIEDNSVLQFEEAVSLAASFAMSIEDQDSLLDLMFVGTESYRFTTGRSFGKAANMLEILACVVPCRDRDIQDLVDMTLQHLGELSGLVIILLAWDQKRQDMVRYFLSLNVPVLVFVITDTKDGGQIPAGPMQSAPQRLVHLAVDDIQAALDRINWATI